MNNKPAKVWVVFGQHPARKVREVPYPTDPRVYGLPILKSMTDEEYAKVSCHMRAFICKEDAIDFSYETGLESGYVLGYRLINGQYVSDTAVTDGGEHCLVTEWRQRGTSAKGSLIESSPITR